MAFLSDSTLEIEIPRNGMITPYNKDYIKYGAYELSLGREVYVTSQKNKTKKVLSRKEQFTIPAGQTALLLTEEEVKIPPDLIAFISIKFSVKFQGLINISGFHVDPGFKGCLKFSVYNAGSNDIVISQGDHIFLIWFCKLDQPLKNPYAGQHINQKQISNDDVRALYGEVYSPIELKKRVDSLESNIKYIIGIGAAALLLILAPIVSHYWELFKGNNTSKISIEMDARHTIRNQNNNAEKQDSTNYTSELKDSTKKTMPQ